jgi:hypothetical protein
VLAEKKHCHDHCHAHGHAAVDLLNDGGLRREAAKVIEGSWQVGEKKEGLHQKIRGKAAELLLKTTILSRQVRTCVFLLLESFLGKTNRSELDINGRGAIPNTAAKDNLNA